MQTLQQNRWLRHRQRRSTTAQHWVVRHAQRQAEQADNRTDQSLRLPIGEAEHGAQCQRRQDRQRRIPGLTASRRARLRCPSRDCVITKPHRQTAALTRAGFVGRPVGDLVLLTWNMVAAILVQLERHGRHPEVKNGLLSSAGPVSGATGGSMHHAFRRWSGAAADRIAVQDDIDRVEDGVGLAGR